MQHHRQSTRLGGHDYTQPGAYFVTLVTEGRINRFGSIQDGEMRPNAAGLMIQREWQAPPGRFPGLLMDAWTLMPNHLHGLLLLTGSSPVQVEPRAPQVSAGSLGAVIRAFKSATTLRFHHMQGPEPLWQRNYYDHILRDPSELESVRAYILTNPLQWALDHENPDRPIK